MSAPYSDTIRLWAVDNRRAGTLENADGTGEVGLGAGQAGTRLAVRFALRLRGDTAETVRYQVFGCGFTIAACAAAAELAEGRTLADFAAITPAAVDALLAGLPPERDYCAQLAVDALQAAVTSARDTRNPVVVRHLPDEDHAPRVTANDPVYRRLIDSLAPRGTPEVDRHLFACAITVTAGETRGLAAALGLSPAELNDLLHLCFPELDLSALEQECSHGTNSAPAANPELLQLICDYLPHDNEGWTPAPSLWLARILATRAAVPGHLWRAMGLFARPELTAAIRRHLPALAAANDQGMRWKRFLFKQLCDRNGGTLCKAPECGECSDSALCFES